MAPAEGGEQLDLTTGELTPVDLTATDAPSDLGAPITAPDKVWTWVPFPGARCANGSPTGIGVNPNKASTKVLLFLQGGGACWDVDSCVNRKLAKNLDGYDQTKFASHNHNAQGIFDRNMVLNPFATWNYVFVPYCTGDLHAGTQYSSVSQQHHVGHNNIALYLQRLIPTFSGASQVLLTGSSAGGFGTMFNYYQVSQAFAPTPVDALDDSGPILDQLYLKPKLQQAWRAAWGLAKSLPAGCTACTTGDLDNLHPYLAGTFPQRKIGLISSNGDLVVRGYFGLGYTPPKLVMPQAEFEQGLDNFADKMIASHSNYKVYYIKSSWHVYLTKATLNLTAVKGVPLRDWIKKLVDGAAGWTNVRP